MKLADLKIKFFLKKITLKLIPAARYYSNKYDKQIIYLRAGSLHP